MATRQIPREAWPAFFKNLSLKQEGWRVSLEVLGPDIGDQMEQREMFLAGLAAELSNDASRPDNIEIMLGGSAGNHLTHMVTAPTEVDLQQTELGVDLALQIKSADGTTSLLYLV